MFTGCAGCTELSRKVSVLSHQLKQLAWDVQALRAEDQTLSVREACLCLEHFICFEVFGASAEKDYLSEFGLVSQSTWHDQDKLLRYLEGQGLNRPIFSEIKKAGGDHAHRERCPLSKAELELFLSNRIKKEHQVKFMGLLERHGIIKDGIVDFNASPAWT